MKFTEKSISSKRRVVSMNRPEVIIDGVEPPRKPKPIRPNTTQRMTEKDKNGNHQKG